MPLRQILIVDNDPSAALVTERGLQRLLQSEAEVMTAPSAGAAWLRCVREGVDLVIVDPSPQSRAVIALIKALREEHPQVPVLVLTAYDTPLLRSQLRDLGVRHYLAKPLELLELAQVVRDALGLAPIPADESGRAGPVSDESAVRPHIPQCGNAC